MHLSTARCLVVAALAVGLAALGAHLGCTSGGGGAGGAVVLTYGQPNSPLLERIAEWATVQPYAESQGLAGCALLLVDGDDVTGELLDEELMVDEALGAGVPVLVLDAREEHKMAGALRELTGVATGGESYGYLIERETVPGARDHHRIVDLSWPDGATEFTTAYAGSESEGQETDEEIVEGSGVEAFLAIDAPEWVYDVWSEEVRAFVSGEHSVQTRQASGEYDPAAWTNAERMKYTHATIQHRAWEEMPLLNASKTPSPTPAAPTANTSKTQLLSSYENYTVYAFLCEYENAAAEYRIIIVQDGQFSPSSGSALFDNGQKYYYWYQTAYHTSVSPASSAVELLEASPLTAVGVASVTDTTDTTIGTKWNVGGTLSPDGLSITGGYEKWRTDSIGSSVTRQVTDWKLNQTSTFGQNVNVQWSYGMNTPYDGLSSIAAKPITGAQLSAGSKSSMGFHATSIWRVPKQTSGAAPVVTFNLVRRHVAQASFYFVFDIGIARGAVPAVFSVDQVVYPAGTSPDEGSVGAGTITVDLANVPTLDYIESAN